jgi:hypothetical protein
MLKGPMGVACLPVVCKYIVLAVQDIVYRSWMPAVRPSRAGWTSRLVMPLVNGIFARCHITLLSVFITNWQSAALKVQCIVACRGPLMIDPGWPIVKHLGQGNIARHAANQRTGQHVSSGAHPPCRSLTSAFCVLVGLGRRCQAPLRSYQVTFRGMQQAVFVEVNLPVIAAHCHATACRRLVAAAAKTPTLSPHFAVCVD